MQSNEIKENPFDIPNLGACNKHISWLNEIRESIIVTSLYPKDHIFMVSPQTGASLKQIIEQKRIISAKIT